MLLNSSSGGPSAHIFSPTPPPHGCVPPTLDQGLSERPARLPVPPTLARAPDGGGRLQSHSKHSPSVFQVPADVPGTQVHPASSITLLSSFA